MKKQKKEQTTKEVKNNVEGLLKNEDVLRAFDPDIVPGEPLYGGNWDDPDDLEINTGVT